LQLFAIAVSLQLFLLNFFLYTFSELPAKSYNKNCSKDQFYLTNYRT